MPMKVSIKEHAGVVVAAIAGEIDGKTAPEAQSAALAAVRDGAPFIIDMSETTYLSSAGLRVLLIVHRESTARSARAVLVGVRAEIRDVMSATGFLRFFTLADTLDAGVAITRG
jgi:anti-sigma B factor antagonist